MISKEVVSKFRIIENTEKVISKLAETRKSIFYIKNPHFNWKQLYSISELRKFSDLQNKIILNENHLKLIVDNFNEWKNIPTYLMFQNIEKGNLVCSLASKRGNKVYEYYLNEKLNNDLGFMKTKNFFKLILRNKKGFRNKKVSNVCFITLTCDPKKYNNNIIEAWLNFEHDYNIFITRLRKRYGKCWIMKSVESTKKGFPHIHLLVITEKEFNVFSHKNKKGFVEYRLNDKRKIENYWPSFVDIIIPNPIVKDKEKGCVDFMKSYIFKDMLKSYVYKEERDFKNNLSLALGWLFGKRCYSISKMDLSLDSITDTSITQTQIKEIMSEKKYIFLGLLDLKFNSNKPPPIELEINKNDPNYETYINAIYIKNKNRGLTGPAGPAGPAGPVILGPRETLKDFNNFEMAKLNLYKFIPPKKTPNSIIKNFEDIPQSIKKIQANQFMQELGLKPGGICATGSALKKCPEFETALELETKMLKQNLKLNHPR